MPRRCCSRRRRRSTASTRIRPATAATPARSSCGSSPPLARRAWPALRDAHVADHRALFDRLTLELPAAPAEELPTDRRIAQPRRRRSRARRAALPVRPLPADRVEPARHAAGQPAGHLERRRAGAVERELHDQHQHPDELLAGGIGQPRRAARAAPRVHRRSRGHRHAHRVVDVRHARLDGAPQLRHLAALGHGRRLGQRRPGVGDVGDGRAVAGAAPLRALPVRRRPRLAARQGVSGAARRRRVRPRLARGRRQGPPRHRAVDVAREQVPARRPAGRRSLPARRWIWR